MIGIDPSLADTRSDTSLGEGIGQTFYAADTLIRSLTVWQIAAQSDWVGSGLEVYIMEADSSGAPDGRTILATASLARTGVGDGIHPIPFEFEFDPPIALPHAGQYGFMLFSCRTFWATLLGVTDDAASGRGYPDGHLWAERTRHVCHPRRRPVPYPGYDMVFRIVFAVSSAPGQIALESARPEPCKVGLVWTDGGTGAPSANVLRRSDGTDWESVGVAQADGVGHLGFEDVTVVPGARYGYSLQIGECAFGGQTTVLTPDDLGVRFVSVEPSEGALRLTWSVGNPEAQQATVYRRGVQTDTRYPVDETWHPVGTGAFGSAGRLVFDDGRVTGGARYHYRLGVAACGREASLGLATGVDVPCGLGVPRLVTEPTNCGVRLRWSHRDSSQHTVALDRRGEGGEWRFLGNVRSDDLGRSQFDDLTVRVGERVAYRLGLSDCGGQYYSNEAAVAAHGVVVSEAVAHAEPDRASLRWALTGVPGTPVTIYRWSAETNWQVLAQVEIEVGQQVRYDDTGIAPVIPRGGYRYRLGIVRCGREGLVGEVRLDVPDAVDLAITGVRPNPTDQDLTVSFFLPDAAPAQFDILDVAGRRIFSRHVGELGLGSHVLNLTEGRALPSGIYLIRLTRGGLSRTTRAVVIRQGSGRVTAGP